jgi:long-chain acyl-CoA synthetase
MESLAEQRMQNDPTFKSLHEFFLNSANNIHNPQKTCLMRKEEGAWKEYSYAYLIEEINKMASFFIESGLEKGDRVAIVLEN